MITLALIVCGFYTSVVGSDGLVDCGEGFNKCSEFNLKIAEFVFSKCISNEFICDGEKDCYYGEDEDDCDIPSTDGYVEATTKISKPITPIVETTMITDGIVPTSDETTIESQTTSDDGLTETSTEGESTINWIDLTTRSITTKPSNVIIDMDLEDKANRDYKALIITIIISILISLGFIICVLIHWKLARKRKRSEVNNRSPNSRFSNNRMSQRKHANHPV